MRRNITVIFLLSFLLGYLLPESEKVFPQEKELILDRILNPLPDYDPFDTPPPSPQFFPDEVDKQVRKALIDSLTNRGGALEDHVRFFMDKDAELKKERGAVTGLTEDVLDLFHNTIQDRERYLAAQKRALASSPSPEQKRLIESRLRNDDLTRADELIKESATNRWGAMLNRLLSSVDLASILSGSYVGAAVDTTMSQLLAAGSTEMSIEERKALTLYIKHLRRHPNDPQNNEVQKHVEALEKKKKRVLVEKQIEKAQKAMGEGELTRAEFRYEIAAFLDPLSLEAEEGLKDLKKLIEQQEDERKKNLSVATGQTSEDATPAEDQDLSGLLYALTLRDPEQIETEAKELEKNYQGKPLAESARDASAVALDIKGQHEEAKKVLQEIANSSRAPRERKRAKILLESPEYNLLASFYDARSQHRLETVKYVLLGKDLLKKSLLYSTTPLIAAGPAGATSVAAANVIMMGSNLYEVLTSNPISNQPVIDKGVAYIRNHPQSGNASEVYRILADAYEEAGMVDKAITYHKMSGMATEEKIADLKEKAAKSLLQAAEKSTKRGVKEFYLKRILDNYPESPAAQEATQKLAALAKIENRGLRMSKNFLMENPELYGPQGLQLKPTLFDGNLSNMELADRGVNLLNEREIFLHFQTPWGVRSRGYPVAKKTSSRLQITLREKNYEVAMGDVHARPKGSPGGMKTIPLPLLKGDLKKEGAGSEEGDTTLTLVREATGPTSTFPRVLDHELISENERDPSSKYKLPPIQGSISASRLDVSGSLPAGFWGDRLTLGSDEKSPFAGLQLPIPLLQGFIPVDFLLQGRPGGFSIIPKIHLYKDKGDDQELYR